MSFDIATTQRWIAERRNINSVYFKDENRKIDAIIVFRRDKFSIQLETFLWNLTKTGLHLEFALSTDNNNLYFVKIHAPDKILIKYAKTYNIPLKKDQTVKFALPKVPCGLLKNILNSPQPDPNDPISKRAWETISKKQPTEITFCERSAIVFSIMDYISYGDNDFDVGLKQLLHNDIVLEAYPLHDGPWEWPEDPNEPINDRQLLAKYWASIYTVHKQQPLVVVEKYFGYEIAMYFAWIGFYNKMLMYASLMGVLAFFGGILYAYTYNMNNINIYCNEQLVRYRCAEHNTWLQMKFSNFCPNAYVAQFNSNLITFIYSCLMIIWCTVFNEMWKRKLNVLNAKWDKTDSEDFLIRPEFVAGTTYVRRHKYTGKPELYLRLGEKILRYSCSVASTILMLFIVLSSIASIIYVESFLKSILMPRFIITIITCTLSVLLMTIVEKLTFQYMVNVLTKVELPRTELDFEKSLMWKLSIYAFINNYGRIIYIAFLKGRFEIPSASLSQICMLPGCVFEVVCMMYTMLLFKPFFENFFEVQRPLLFKIGRKILRGTINLENKPRWEKEYVGNNLGTVLSELEEMMIQYGLVTCFAACCPLAPLFALLHNFIEIKVDAIKILKYYKRPVEKKQVSSVQIWFDILESMTYVIIVVNACFMTYTCDVAYLLYDYFIVDDKQTLFSFLYYSTDDANNCYIDPPMSYHVTREKQALQAGFALFLIILGFASVSILSYIIPDKPRSLREYLHQQERKRKNK